MTQRLVSVCCGEESVHEPPSDGAGFCSGCREWTTFEPDEDPPRKEDTMTEQTHTKGPWALAPGELPNGDPFYKILAHNETPQECAIADVYDAGGNLEAHAALIVLAPETLAALGDILRLLSTIEVLGEWEALDINPRSRAIERAKVDVAVDNARDVIAKTRGVSP